MAEATDSTFHPRSLRSLCLSFVAKNIEFVESLLDFPEDIGKELWLHAEQTLNIYDGPHVLCVMKLFYEAYADYVLTSLNVNGRHYGLEQCLDCILMFSTLGELNLSACKLGDDHPLIVQIAPSFQMLQKLGLADNALTDVGIQRLTSPLRICGRGPARLKSIDLSCNPKVTTKALKYLKCFTDLCELDLSGTAVNRQDTHLVSGFPGMAVSSADGKICFRSTEGWMGLLMEKWLSAGPAKKCHSDQQPSKSSSFYSTKRRREQLIDSIPTKTKAQREPVIFLHRTIPLPKNSTDNRTCVPLNLTVSNHTKPTEKKVVIDEAAMNIMMGYL